MMKESEQMRVTKKIKEEQLKRLSEVYHDDGTMLHFTSPFTLLVAVILSAQCTDKRVNVITGRIFPRLASPEKMGALRQEELEMRSGTAASIRRRRRTCSACVTC